MTGLPQVQIANAAAVSPDDLGAFGAALGRSRLGEYIGCFDLLAPRREDWHRHRDRAPDALRPLIDLFLLGRVVSPAALPGDVGDRLCAAEAAGLLARCGRGVAMMDDLAIVPVLGRWLICQPPQPGQRLYFGDDTMALLSRTRPRPGGRCLDLCTGPGMLALHAAGIAGHVVAVERTPAAVRLARLNVRLNALSHRISVREGDLYGPVAGLRFDTVIANPPLLPLPDAIDPPALGHAGEDGLRVTGRLLGGLPDILSANGTAQMIGMAASDGATPACVEPLRTAAGDRLDLTVSIVSHRPIFGDAGCLDAIVTTAAAACGLTEAEVRAAYRAMLARSGTRALCHFFVHARHGSGRFDLIDMAATGGARAWTWRR